MFQIIQHKLLNRPKEQDTWKYYNELKRIFCQKIKLYNIKNMTSLYFIKN